MYYTQKYIQNFKKRGNFLFPINDSTSLHPTGPQLAAQQLPEHFTGEFHNKGPLKIYNKIYSENDWKKGNGTWDEKAGSSNTEGIRYIILYI